MDTHFHALQQGVGTQVNHAKLLTLEANLMWELGVIGSDTPQAFLKAVSSTTGRNFCDEEARSIVG